MLTDVGQETCALCMHTPNLSNTHVHLFRQAVYIAVDTLVLNRFASHQHATSMKQGTGNKGAFVWHMWMINFNGMHI